jgi:phosphoglucosamine mutase
MTRNYFGTDGIRGTANQEPMTAEIALKVGMAAGAHFSRGSHRHKVVIGKDTRLSGYMVEPALTAGFISVGIDVFLVGPMPTPAVAMLTRSLRADLGVMISASHNPYHDNGIKLFDRRGLKLSDTVESEIEKRMSGELEIPLADPDKLGRAKRLDDAPGRYIEFVKHSFPRRSNLSGLKVVVDCANGAAYHLAEKILWELEAEVIALGTEPNGFNINEQCGAMHPEAMAEAVKKHGADVGIALDGDADRLIVCDENGKVIDGDQILALIARHQKELGTLQGDGIVATSMSNMGLEAYLEAQGLVLHRTDVGDRYVAKFMREQGYNVGGEQSGHIIMRDYTTTGDGLIAALQVLAVLVKEDKPASKVFDVFKPYPQLLKNVRYKDKSPLEHKEVQAAIEAGEKVLAGSGRVLIRKSGTEPLIRVMAEGKDEKQVERVVDDIVASVEAAV